MPQARWQQTVSQEVLGDRIQIPKFEFYFKGNRRSPVAIARLTLQPRLDATRSVSYFLLFWRLEQAAAVTS